MNSSSFARMHSDAACFLAAAVMVRCWSALSGLLGDLCMVVGLRLPPLTVHPYQGFVQYWFPWVATGWGLFRLASSQAGAPWQRAAQVSFLGFTSWLSLHEFRLQLQMEGGSTILRTLQMLDRSFGMLCWCVFLLGLFAVIERAYAHWSEPLPEWCPQLKGLLLFGAAFETVLTWGVLPSLHVFYQGSFMLLVRLFRFGALAVLAYLLLLLSLQFQRSRM